MRRALLLAALSLAAAHAAAAQHPLGCQTFTDRDLATRGVVALHEMLRWAEALHAPTVDGFDVLAVARPVGTGPLAWTVDGLPVSVGTSLEPDGAELLPVTLAEVASVTVCAGDAGRPSVALATRRPLVRDVARQAMPAHVVASVAYGNEGGDPGPLRYLDPALPNVDRWGPFYEALVVAPRARWDRYATLSARERSHFPTDTAMVARVRDALAPGRFPKRRLGTATAAARWGGWRARAATAWGDDLPHVLALGRELPLQRRHLQASAGGPLARVGTVAVRVQGHAARLALEAAPWGASPWDPAWTETRAQAAISASDASGPSGSGWGAGVRADVVRAEAAGWDATVGAGHAWGEAVRADSLRLRRVRVGAMVSGGDAVLSGQITQVTARPGGGSVLVSLAAARRAGHADPTLADWRALGFAGLGGRATLDVGPGGLPPRGEAVARLSLRQPVTPQIAAEVTAEVQHAEGPVELPRFTARADTAAPVGTTVVGRGEGVAGTAHMALTWSRSAAWTVRVFGRAQAPLSRSRGGNAFAEAWDRLPTVRGGAEATWRPDARLSAWARLDASTATRWAGYPDPRVPGNVRLDLGMEAALAGGRARLGLAGRNALGGVWGTREQTHPLGASLAPRLFVKLEARL